jgi:hypothetical protein
LPSTPPASDEERRRISDSGLEIYNRKLKALLEPDLNGQIVAIHLDSEDYEVAPHASSALAKLRTRHADGLVVTTDIGPVDPFDPLSLRMLGRQLMDGQSRS